MLRGYLTYIGAFGLMLVGAYQWFSGDHESAVRSFAEALTLSGLRRAISSLS